MWSLGIILINMVTVRSPWNKAHTSDTNFHDFINNEQTFRRSLPVSRTFDIFLYNFFNPDVSKRWRAPHLRKYVSKARDFFIADWDLPDATIACLHAIRDSERRIKEAKKEKSPLRIFVKKVKQFNLAKIGGVALRGPLLPIPRVASPPPRQDTPFASRESTAVGAASSSDASSGVATPTNQSLVATPRIVEGRSSMSDRITDRKRTSLK